MLQRYFSNPPARVVLGLETAHNTKTGTAHITRRSLAIRPQCFANV
jgi:hypothetical protein